MVRGRQLEKRRQTGRLAKRREARQEKFLKRKPSLIKRIPALRKKAKEIVKQQKLQEDIKLYSEKLSKGEISNINQVPSDVRPFFNFKQIQDETISKINPEIEKANLQYNEIKADFDNRKQSLRDWRTNALKGLMGDERQSIHDNYDKEFLDLEEAFKPNMEFYQETSQRLTEQLNKIKQGELLSFEGVKNYAKAYANFEKRKEELTLENIQIQEKNRQLKALLEEAVSQGELQKIRSRSTGKIEYFPTGKAFIVESTSPTGEKTGQVLSQEFEELYKFKPQQIADLDKEEVIQQVEIAPETLDLSMEKALVEDDDLVSDRIDRGFFESLRGRITGLVTSIMGDKEKDREKGKEVFEDKGLRTVSAFDPKDFDVELESTRKKTKLETIKDLPSETLEQAREFSKQQAEFVGAEQLLGMGGVGEIGGRDIKRFQEPEIKSIIRKGLEIATPVEIDLAKPIIKKGIEKGIEKGVETLDEFLETPIKTEFFEPQFGTIQRDPVTGEELGFKKIEVETTRKELLEPFLETAGFISKGVTKGLEGTAVAWEDIFEQKRKLRDYARALDDSKLKNKLLKHIAGANSPNWVMDIQEKIIVGYVRHGGRLVLYTIPYVGLGLIAIDTGAAGNKFVNAEKTSENIGREGYKDYKIEQTPLLKEGERILTEKEYLAEVVPLLVDSIKGNALVELALGATFLAGAVALGGTRAIKNFRRTRFESANFNEVKTKVDAINKLGKYRDFKEPTGQTFGLTRRNLEELGLKRLGLSDDLIKNLDSVEASISSQPIIQTFAKSVKTPVADLVKKFGKDVNKGLADLAKKTDNWWSVSVTEKTSYRNVLSLVVNLKDGSTRVISTVFITNKPLQRFRSLQSALKYARGKKLVLSAVREGEEFIKSGVYKI